MKSKISYGIVLIIIIFNFSIIPVLSQSGFNDGYIITNQNDSIFGKISAYPNKQNIKYCILKGQDGEVNYSQDMMRYFGFIDGDCFAANVLRDTIIQVLVKGRLNLYKSHSTFYILKEGDELKRLETYTNKVIRNGEMFYVEDVKWKGTIAYLVSDCNIDQNALKDLRLVDNQLTDFVVAYNKCSKSDYVEFGSNKKWTKVTFGITSSIAQSTMKVENSYTENYYMNQSYTSIDPSIGVIFTITYPRINQKLQNQVEINYNKTSYSSSKTYSFSSMDETYNTYFDFDILSVPISFQYLPFRDQKNIFSIQAGGEVDFFLKSESKIVKQVTSVNGDFTTESDPFNFKKYHAGLFGGIGYQKKFEKFSSGISLRYFYIINSTFRPQFDINTQRIALSLYITTR